MKKIIIFFLISFLLLSPLVALAKISPWLVTSNKVGLNVHWALGGFGEDSLYRTRLHQSRTKWVREHFYTEVFMVENPEAWFERYDYVLEQYHQQGIKVLGMLAYGPEHGDFQQPNLELWEDFVRTIIHRYKNRVAAWEIWNEPDSPTYLTPHNPETYGPILAVAYRTIKNTDPDALVLTGGLQWPNFYFAEKLFQDYNQYFDRLAVHAYYCQDGNNNQLMADLNSLQEMVNKYRPGQKIWITELGCSTGSSGISESYQKNYLEDTTTELLASGFVEKIFLYNFRNRDLGDSYEDNFGLLTFDLKSRPAWNWYRHLPLGPYDQPALKVSKVQKQAAELKDILEKYFGVGKIPISAENWPKLVDAYIYGGYPVQAIVQAIRFGDKTVHLTIPYKYWKESQDYKTFINKDLVNGRFVYAYGKSRQPIEKEQQKADELKQKLQSQFGLEHLRIDSSNWVNLVNAYIYGGYPVEAISRAIIYGGKTVHLTIPWRVWQQHPDYRVYIGKPIAGS